jgi:hypothetical protein
MKTKIPSVFTRLDETTMLLPSRCSQDCQQCQKIFILKRKPIFQCSGSIVRSNLKKGPRIAASRHQKIGRQPRTRVQIPAGAPPITISIKARMMDPSLEFFIFARAKRVSLALTSYELSLRVPGPIVADVQSSSWRCNYNVMV